MILQQSNRFYAFLVIVLCGFFLIYKYVLQVSPGIMTSQLMSVFHVTGAGLGNLAAIYFYAYLIMQIFAGALVDKLGVRYLAVAAMLIATLGAYWFGISDHLSSAFIARGLMGVGIAFATVIYLKSAAIWFSAKRFPLVAGCLGSAAMLGAIFGEAPLSILVNGVGWRHAFSWIALVGLVLAILYWLFFRDTKTQHGLLEEPHTNKKVGWGGILKVLKNRDNWFLLIYEGCAVSPIAAFGGLWGNPFLRHVYHCTATQASSLLTFIFVGFGVGAPLMGYLAKWFDPRRLMVVTTFIALLCLSAAIYTPGLNYAWLAFFFLMFGLFIGSFMLCFTLGRSINGILLAGTVVAMINMGDGLSALADPLIGKILDLNWHHQLLHGARVYSAYAYHLAFSVLPIYLIIAIILLYFLRQEKAS